MAYRGSEQVFTDFSGGMVSNKPPHTIPLNASSLVKNIVLTPGGGFRQRWGDVEFNGTAMGDPSAITGLASYLPTTNQAYLMAISKSSIYKSEMDGTMDDITGAVTITADPGNIWTFTQMNDLAIFVGGAPNAPIKWNATGNAAVLGGTPPNGAFGFQVNNRLFIGNTTANPSRIQWSILSNPEDWSGAGSGSSDIWTNDGDQLMSWAILSNDIVLLFKNKSIHQMIVTSAPFPIFPLFKNVGACGKNAVTVVSGIAYFMTSDAKIKATDGSQIIEIPHEDIDDIFENLNMSRLKYVQASYQQGDGYSYVIFCCSLGTSTTNDICIVWDLNNKCWLYYPTGYACNVLALTQDMTLYGGHTNGKVYQKDKVNTNIDASVTSGVIGGLWRWGWRANSSFMYSARPNKLTLTLQTQSTGFLKVGYGFDYNDDTITEQIDQRSTGMLWDSGIWDNSNWGGANNTMKTIYLKGFGNVYQHTIFNDTANVPMKINGFSLGFKKQAQREMSAT